MNNLFFGFAAIAAVLFFSLEGKIDTYVNFHSFMIVIGGTIAILVFSTPGNVLRSLWRNVQKLPRPEGTVAMYKDQIQKLTESKLAQIGPTHKLISYAQELWEQGIDHDLFIVLLSQKKKEIEGRTTDAIQALKNLSKYPPTLGMTGTVMGMIALFSA